MISTRDRNVEWCWWHELWTWMLSLWILCPCTSSSCEGLLADIIFYLYNHQSKDKMKIRNKENRMRTVISINRVILAQLVSSTCDPCLNSNLSCKKLHLYKKRKKKRTKIYSCQPAMVPLKYIKFAFEKESCVVGRSRKALLLSSNGCQFVFLL